MLHSKRKHPPPVLGRRVRPRVETEDLEAQDVSDLEQSDPASKGSSADDNEENSDDDGEESGDFDSASEGSESDAEAEAEAEAEADVHQVSFGALAKAQAALRREGEGASTKRRERAGLKHTAQSSPANDTTHESTRPRKPTAARASKHAPQEQSSSRQVSRKRQIAGAEPPHSNRQHRGDPRFDPALGHLDETGFRRAYAFLDGYRADEMRTLRGALAAAPTPAAREELQRALKAMEGRKDAQERRDRERALVGEHRARERDLVRKGKQPFFLKRAEVKRQVLVDRFAQMKKGQVDRAIERRRKKVAAKERRELPLPRRRVGGDEEAA